MSLVINNNMMAANTARILGNTYNKLSQSTQRLSSGLRINGASDDAAGLAIRELMRSDIATMKQGIRNAADGISLLQTAEGAMAVIDEKLTRMKELAEQAATGTYTTVQREIINSEYQAMAAEIDRIANSTEFNGVKLLDGSISAIHQGQGLKIHFGTGNSEAEDYYFIQIGDIRATSESGLRIAGDAKNDIWGTVGTHNGANTAGCCGGGIPTIDQPVQDWKKGDIFAYGYNWDWKEVDDDQLSKGRYIGGAYQVGDNATLQEILDAVNRGTQARVRVDISSGMTLGHLLSAGTGGVSGIFNSSAQRFCFGDEVYYYGSTSLGESGNDPTKKAQSLGTSAAAGTTVIQALASAINSCASSQFWARIEETNYGDSNYSSLYVFAKEGGDMSKVAACDDQLGAIRNSATYKNQVIWYNDEADSAQSAGTYFNNGGKFWGTLKAVPTGYGSWGVQLHGKDVGREYDLQILNVGNHAQADINVEKSMGGKGFGKLDGTNWANNLLGMDRESFVEIQNAADGAWDGAHVRTQSHAQEALDAIQRAIENKDKVRASLGAYQNRLENTITNMEIYAENLQASESRISDVDMATEMTTFVKNQVLTQAAISMLSQANSLPQMALSLLNG